MGTGTVEVRGARTTSTGDIDGQVKQGYTDDALDVNIVSQGGALYGSNTLDMTDNTDYFVISNTDKYSTITLFITGVGGASTASVKGDLIETQTDTVYSSKIGFRTCSGTDNHTTAITDLTNNISVERGGLLYSALKVYVSTQDAGGGTATVRYILRP